MLMLSVSFKSRTFIMFVLLKEIGQTKEDIERMDNNVFLAPGANPRTQKESVETEAGAWGPQEVRP